MISVFVSFFRFYYNFLYHSLFFLSVPPSLFKFVFLIQSTELSTKPKLLEDISWAQSLSKLSLTVWNLEANEIKAIFNCSNLREIQINPHSGIYLLNGGEWGKRQRGEERGEGTGEL